MKNSFKKVSTFALVSVLLGSCTRTEVIPKEVTKEVEKEVVKVITKEVINEIEKEVIKNVEVDSAPEVSLMQMTKEQVKEKGTEMLTEADDQIIDGNKMIFQPAYRSFKPHTALGVKMLADGKYQIQNYLPQGFSNVILIGKIKDLEMYPVKLVKFDRFPAFYELKDNLPLSDKETFFEDIEGNKVSGEYFSKIPPGDWELSLLCEDPLFKQFSSIKLILNYRFGEYAKDNKWDRVRWKDARSFVPIVINFAYVFDSDEFKSRVLNYEHDFYNDNAKTPLNKQRVWESFVKQSNGKYQERRQNLGIIVKPGLGGLGGGEAFGVRREYFNNKKSIFYDPNAKGQEFVLHSWIHEFSHVAGYGHNGNMTYSRTPAGKGGTSINDIGLVPIVMRLYKEMLTNKQLPFSEFPLDENYNPKNE